MIMTIKERKKRILDIVASTNDVNKISKIERVLFKDEADVSRLAKIQALSGAWSHEFADEIEQLIEQSCEKIDRNEW